jgi:hypothetical protein
LYSGVRRHDEFTRALRLRNARRAWFEGPEMRGAIPISI